MLDFYCPELKLAIEVDGGSHRSTEAVKTDLQRQKEIERYGIRFLRFRDEDVLVEIDKVMKVIHDEVLDLARR
ncbi:MAG: DUF559 domain-containing protein [Ignavibacteria bacterium]|nr:DUF559 domain-containing protein [Ignavibacteria bacterium]